MTRTTIDISEYTYARLRQRAAERGVQDHSKIIEEALELFLEVGDQASLVPGLTEADGAWSEGDVDDWERARREAWATWPWCG
jgi:predicted transcriptional regulator